jgi:Rieske Fe-S protein
MVQFRPKRAKYLIFFLMIFFILNGCKKINSSQVPDVPFTLLINLNIQNSLLNAGSSVYFPGYGFGGVIVTCESPGVYYAYDATCTYELSQTCKIKNEGLLGTCSCCGSKFVLLYEAYPSSGPAAAPLKQYQITQVNSFTLRVYN